MGDYYVKLIPLKPDFVPKQKRLDKLDKILPVLQSWAEEVKVIVYEHPIFVDQGQNFEKVSCPFCKQELDADWWGRAMDAADKSDYTDLKIVVPCCRKRTSLNNLEYDFPAGFARFIIEFLEPGLMEEEEIEWLEKQLRCKLKVVKAKY